jgi:hypothetical protein
MEVRRLYTPFDELKLRSLHFVMAKREGLRAGSKVFPHTLLCPLAVLLQFDRWLRTYSSVYKSDLRKQIR